MRVVGEPVARPQITWINSHDLHVLLALTDGRREGESRRVLLEANAIGCASGDSVNRRNALMGAICVDCTLCALMIFGPTCDRRILATGVGPPALESMRRGRIWLGAPAQGWIANKAIEFALAGITGHLRDEPQLRIMSSSAAGFTAAPSLGSWRSAAPMCCCWKRSRSPAAPPAAWANAACAPTGAICASSQVDAAGLRHLAGAAATRSAASPAIGGWGICT